MNDITSGDRDIGRFVGICIISCFARCMGDGGGMNILFIGLLFAFIVIVSIVGYNGTSLDESERVL